MKVKVLKTGHWATNPPENDKLILVEGEQRTDIPMHCIEKMVSAGWIEVLYKEKTPPDLKATSEDTNPSQKNNERQDIEQKEDEEEYSVTADLKDIVSAASSDKEAKDLLKIWAAERGFKVKKTFGVQKIVAKLIKDYNAS